MADTSTSVSINIQTEVDESRISSATEKITGLSQALKNYRDLAAYEGDDQQADYFDYIYSSLSKLSGVLTTLESSFSNIGSISGNIKKTFNTIDSSISDFMRSLKSYGEGKTTSSDLLMKSLNFSEGSELMSKYLQSFQKNIGWSQSNFQKMMPVMMAKTINPLIKEYDEGAFFGRRPTFNSYVDALSRDKTVIKGIKTISGNSKMTDEEVRNTVERALLSYSPRAIQQFGADAVAHAPIQKAAATIYAHDIIPEKYRAAFYGRGYARTEEAKKLEDDFIARLPVQKNNYVPKDIYRQIRKYVSEDDNGVMLHDILRQAKIMDVRGGRRVWAEHLTPVQASLLGGLSAQELYNARRGYAFYDADPNDPASERRVDHRMSKRVQAHLALQNMLAQDTRIVPTTNIDLSSYEKLPDASDYLSYAQNSKKKGARVTYTGTPDQFVLPKTYIDHTTGQLVKRDEHWQKPTGNLFDEREEDQYAIITDSPLLELVKQIGFTGKRTGRQFGFGNGTYGYGRDDSGKAVYDTMPFIKISTDQFFETDKTTNKQVLKPELAPFLKNITSGKTFDYGDSQYVYGYQGDNGIYMVQKELKKKIDDWYDARNLPSFFEGLNASGLDAIDDYGKLIKQINGMKKGSSTSRPYGEVFGDLVGHGKNGELNTRIMNISAWYKALGYSDEDIPDGAAFGNASVFRNGPLQMRSAVGYGKYVLNPMNIKTVFDTALAGLSDEEKKNIGESAGSNWLFSKGKRGIEIWAPSITATEQETRALKEGNLGLLSEEDRKRYGTLGELRRQKFFVANDDYIDLIQTDKTAKQFEAFRYLSAKHYGRQYKDKYGSEASAIEAAKKEGRYNANKGIVELLPEEQGEMHNRATPSYMVMRSAWDFANDPTIMSQQTAAAIKISPEMIKRSDAEFSRRIFNLRTAEGRMDALKANPFYARQLAENPGFAYSREAQGYIESQIRMLEEKQLSGYIATPKTGDQKISTFNRVAALTPGALIEPVLRAANIDESKLPLAIQSLLPHIMDENGEVYTSNQLIKDGVNAYFKRDPNAPAQSFIGKNMHDKTFVDSSSLVEVMKNFGVDEDTAKQAIWFSQRQARKMNTGDFDGDVVSAIIGLDSEQEERIRAIDEAIEKERKRVEENNKLRPNDPNKKPVTDVSTARIEALQRYKESTSTMGAASKMIREAMNLPDTDPHKWSKAYEGMKLYDFASSEQRTQGLDPVISEYGLQTVYGGNTFERFTNSLRKLSGKEDEDIKEAHLGRDIFKSKLPTWNDPQGIMARLMLADQISEGSYDYSNFTSSMKKIMDLEYGDSKSSEALAARWYSGAYSKTTFGRLLSDNDLAKGDDLAISWLRSMNMRGVTRDDEEYMQYNRFRARLDELRESDSQTYSSMVERSARLQDEYRRTGSMETKAEWDLVERSLAAHEKMEPVFSELSEINNKEWRKRERRAAKEEQAITARDALEAVAAEEKKNDIWDTDAVRGNWSSFKNWIKKPITLEGKILSKEGVNASTPFNISFDSAEDRLNVADEELFGKHTDTEHILIGNIMHKAFENYFTAAAKSELNGKTIDDFMGELVTESTEYTQDLAKFGLGVRKIQEQGKPTRYKILGNSGSSGYQKLENLLPTINNGGISSMQDFLDALKNEGFDIEHPENIEGSYITYKNGKFVSMDKTGEYEEPLSIPTLDSEGKATGEQVVKRTHARPDLILKHKNGKSYIVDYKSRYDGAKESLVQSAFYASMIDSFARRAWTHKDEKGNALTADQLSQYEVFKQAGHLDQKTGEYVSDIAGAIGFDPRTRKSVLIERTGKNAQYFDEGRKLAEEALLEKEKDIKGLLDYSSYSAARRNHETITRQVSDKLNNVNNGLVGENAIKIEDQKELDFFLSKYQSDLDTIRGVRSALYKEQDRPERSYNRFQGYERKLTESLDDKVVQAVIQTFANGKAISQSPVAQELSDEMINKIHLLSDNEKLGIVAATTDWDKAQHDVVNSLNGISTTAASKTLQSVDHRIRQAESSREFLKSRYVVDEETGKKSYVYGLAEEKDGEFRINPADMLLSAKQQADMFVTKSDNSILAEKASAMREEFLQSIKAQEAAQKAIDVSMKNFTQGDKAEQESNWATLIGEIKDPSETLSQVLDKKIKDAQHQIDVWNSEITEWESDLRNGKVTDSMVPWYQQMISTRKSMVEKAQKDMSSGHVVDNFLTRKEASLSAENPEQRSEEWLKERKVLSDYYQQAVDQADEYFQKILGNGDREEEKRAAEKLSEAIAKRDKADEDYKKYRIQAHGLKEIWKNEEDNSLSEFDRRTTGTQLSLEDRVKQRIENEKAYALKQSVDNKNSKEVQNEWFKRYEDQAFWDSYYKRELENEKRIDTVRSNEKVLKSRNSVASITSDVTGEMIDANTWASLQATQIRDNIRARIGELPQLIKDEKDTSVKGQLQEELTRLNALNTGDLQNRLLGLRQSSDNLRNIGNASRLRSLIQTFGGSVTQSLNDMAASAVENAQAQVEQYIQANPQMTSQQQAEFRARFSNTDAIRERVTDAFYRQQDEEALNLRQRSFDLLSRTSEGAITPDDRIALQVDSTRHNAARLMRDLEERMTAPDTTMAQLDQMMPLYNRLAGINFDRYQSSLEDEQRYEGYAARDSISKEVQSIMDKTSGRQLTFDEQLQRRRADYERSIEDEKQRLRTQRRLGRYSGRMDEYNDKMNDLNMINLDTWEQLERDRYQNSINVRQAQADAQSAVIERQIAARQRGIDYSQQDFARQRAQSLNMTMFGRNYATYENRRIQLERSQEARRDQIAALEQANKVNDEKLKQKDLKDEDRKLIEQNKNDNLNQIKAYEREMTAVDGQIKALSGSGIALHAAFDTAGQAVGRLMQRFGRRIFMRAYQETIQFVKQFNASMTEIQAITMKTDEQMAEVRTNTIDKALEMKTSVSNVATTEAALYRQGLSDAEVESRTEDVIKFSSVAGIKVEAATKILTTALQNGLVASSEEAMDALVALGDSAATTADEIGKAMQKCASAANVAGVSYEELTAMLTVMTSMTQLSGTQVGTAMNTILTRMRNVTSSKLVKDENGEITTLNEVESALSLAGINLRDANDRTKFRNASDILLDISKKWGSLSDVQKANITTSVAGTRMGNMFQTLMEGMSSDNGETFEKYLNLASDSAGITDKKYDIKMQGLAASMDQLKTSWDALVSGLETSGTATGFTNFIGGVLKLMASFTNNAPGFIVAATAVAAAIAGIAALVFTPGGATIKLIAAGAATAAAAALMGSVGGVLTPEKVDEKKEAKTAAANYTYYKDESEKRASNYRDYISSTKSILNNAKSKAVEAGKTRNDFAEYLSQDDTNKLTYNLSQLRAAFPDIASGVDVATASLGEWNSVISQAESSVESFVSKAKDQASRLAEIDFKLNFGTTVEEKNKTIEEAFPELKIDQFEGLSMDIMSGTRISAEEFEKIKENNETAFMLRMTEEEIASYRNALSIVDASGGNYNELTDAEKDVLEYSNRIANEEAIINSSDYTEDQKNVARETRSAWLEELEKYEDYESILKSAREKETFNQQLATAKNITDQYDVYTLDDGTYVRSSRSKRDPETKNVAFTEADLINLVMSNGLNAENLALISSSEVYAGTKLLDSNGEEIVLSYQQAEAYTEALKEYALNMYKNGLTSFIPNSTDADLLNEWIKNPESFSFARLSEETRKDFATDISSAIAGDNELVNAYNEMRQMQIDSTQGEIIDSALTYAMNMMQVDDEYGHYEEVIRKRIEDALKQSGAIDENGHYQYGHQGLTTAALFTTIANIVKSTREEGENALADIPLSSYQYQVAGKGYDDLTQAREQAAIIAEQAGVSREDAYKMFIRTGNGEIVYGDSGTMSMSSMLKTVGASRTDKDKGYKDQYRNLYNLIASAGDVNPLLMMEDASEYQGLLQDDKEFEEMMKDIETNKGQGKFSYEEVRDYLEKKIFGDTLDNIVNTVEDQYTQLSDMAADMPTEMNDSSISRVAEVTGWNQRKITEDWEGALEEYQKKMAELEANMQTTLYSALADMFEGTEITDAVISQMNSLIAFTGFTAEKNGESFSLSYNGAKPGSGSSWTSGLNDYSKYHLNTEYAAVGRQILNSGKSWNDINYTDYFDTESEWNGLLNYVPELKEYLRMSDEQRGSTQGQNLERTITTKFETVELEGLEEANLLLAGTVENVEKLRQGGTVALEVVTKMRTEAYESGQQTAKLYSGNISEQDEAAMAILGMSEDQFYQDRAGNIELAKQYQQHNSAVAAASYKAERESYGDLKALNIARMMRGADVGKIDAQIADIKAQQATLDQINASRGYFWNKDTQEYDYDPTRIKVNYTDEATRVSTAQAQAKENDLIQYYRALANGETISKEGANLLLDNDEYYAALRNANVSNDIVNAYAARKATGNEGTFADNYGWMMQNIFGADWQNMSTDMLTEGMANYQNLYSDPLQKAIIDMMFSAMPNGSEIQKALSGADVNYESVIQQFTEGLLTETLAGNRNAAEIAANAATLAYGTTQDKNSLLNTYFGQARDVEGAYIAAIGANTAENRSTLASYLGVDETTIKRMMNSEEGREDIQKAIKEQSKETYKNMAESLKNAFDLDIDTNVDDLDSLKDQISAAAVNASDDVKALLEMFLNILGDVSSAVENPGDINAAFDTAMEQLGLAHNTEKGYDWLSKNWENALDNVEFNEQYDDLLSEYNEAYENDDYDRMEALKAEAENLGVRIDRDEYDNAYIQGLNGKQIYGNAAQALQAEAENAGVNWNTFMSDNPLVAAAMNQYTNGNMTNGQMQTLFDYGFSDAEKDFGYYDTLASSLSSRSAAETGTPIYENGQFNAGESVEEARSFINNLKEMQTAEDGSAEILDELIAQFPKLQDVMNMDVDEQNIDKYYEAMKDVNSEATSSKIAALNKYTKANEKVAEAMAKIRKGGKDAAQGMAMLREIGRDRSDQMTAAMVGAKDKKGNYKAGSKLSDQTRNVIASMFDDIDADELKDYTAEQMEDLLKDIPDYLNQTLVDDLNGAIAGMDIPVNMDGLTINADGSVDLSALEAALSAADSQIYEDLKAMVEAQGGEWGSVKFGVNDQGQLVVISADTKFNKKGRYSKGGAGKKSGGGGGKSAADKAIENANYNLLEPQHRIKLAETAYSYYENYNDYGGMVASLGNEINAQKALQEAYRRNLQMLQSQRSAVSAGSEDWWKLTKEIYAAEEAMKEIDNTIESLNSKKLEIVNIKHSYEDAPGQHKRNLLSTYAERYLNDENYKAYQDITGQQIDAIRNDMALNEDQIKELEILLATYKEGSKAWLDVRNEIWAKKEENATYENEIAEIIRDQQAQRLAQITQALERGIETYEANSNIQSTYGQLYQERGNFKQYRQTLQEQNKNNKATVSLYENAIKDIRAEMATLETYSTSWYNARSALLQYEEALAQINVAIEQNNDAIAQSKVEELAKKYEDAASDIEHNITMRSGRADRAKDYGNYKEYIQELTAESKSNDKAIANQMKYLEKLHNMEGNTSIRNSTVAWEELQEKIQQAEESLEKYKGTQSDLSLEIVQAQIENIEDIYNNGRNGSSELGATDLQHEISMTQYVETKYKNRGELTNYGKALKDEQKYQNALLRRQKQERNMLLQLRDNYTAGTPEYDKVMEKIRQVEQEIAKTTNTIDSNTKAQKENEQAIRKVQITLEKTIDAEIKKRIQEERDMLSATVQAQNAILEVIKQRYKDEWAVMKKDIEKKKQALQEEKNLINQRLQARKDAENQEDRYTQLAEYQKQLAFIESDPTRSKEAKELRNQIEQLQKEISSQIATDVANAQTQLIDDQIKGYSDYESNYENELNKLLEDNNNFSTEIDKIFEGGKDAYIEYMRENNEAWKNALPESRKQMEQGWEDTWNKSIGYVQTYWEQVDETMRSRSGFINYMKESTAYSRASEKEQEAMVYEWEKQFDDYKASLKNTYTGAESAISKGITVDDLQKQLKSLENYTFSVKLSSDSDDLSRQIEAMEKIMGYYKYGTKEYEDAAKILDDLYKGVGGNYDPYAGSSTSASSSGGSSGGSSSSGKKSGTGKTKTKTGTYYKDNGSTHSLMQKWSDGSETVISTSSHTYQGYGYNGYMRCSLCGHQQTLGVRNAGGNTGSGTTRYAKAYAGGGLVDYTGPAWVDGTKTRPEAFLDAVDTQNIRSMLDAFDYVKNYAVTSMINPSNFASTDNSIGDVYITINQAEMNSETDIHELAKQLGREFAKDLSKRGFNTASYAF